MNESIRLTDTPDFIQTEEEWFVYLEARGPFHLRAPLAWRDFWRIAAARWARSDIRAMAGLSRVDDSLSGDEACIYQAGLCLVSKPVSVPDGLSRRMLAPGVFARFELTGPYAQLAHAYPRAFARLDALNRTRRPEFCREIYRNDPASTPEAQLRTDLLIPVVA
jgi:DNA gyrase inhibitor GyrI